MGAIANGISLLFNKGRKHIGHALDNFWVNADTRKAINDEVINKFKPNINRARAAENKRADNIKELGDKLAQSRQALQDAQKVWQDKYNTALADAKNQRQTDISNYDAELKRYQDALDQAKAGRQDILDQLYDSEANFDPYKTLYTDVHTGEKYILDQLTGIYENITKFSRSKNINTKDIKKLRNYIQGFEDRLFDSKSKKVINAFDPSNQSIYKNNNIFDRYYSGKINTQNGAIRNADNQITKANDDLTTWSAANTRPSAWDDANDLKPFENGFNKNNGASPTDYSFNGQTYSKEADLIDAYNKAVKHETALRDSSHKIALKYTSQQKQEIAKRIQDAKDIKKAKLALGAGAGVGALVAGAAMYGGDDTDNTDNTYNGEPDPDFNAKKEGQAILNDEQRLDTDFNPDKADALASAAYDQGVEDGNAARSSEDLVNNIRATTGGHTIDDRLYELLKAMKDPYKADAVANYIYSRHGDDPEVQRLGWRGWLNKYYGDSLRSIMNIDPSGYKGMHISGGL